MHYFLKKRAGFRFLLNFKFEKVVTLLFASFALSKNKKSEASRLIVTPPPSSPALPFCKCLVCFFFFIYTIFVSIICVSQDDLVCICVKQCRSGTKVPRLGIYRFMISLNEITYQMWNDIPFSQRNKTSKILVEVKVGDNGKDRFNKMLKSWGRATGAVRNPLPTITHTGLFLKRMFF